MEGVFRVAGYIKECDLSQFPEDITSKVAEVLRVLDRTRYDKALAILDIARDLLQERAYVNGV